MSLKILIVDDEPQVYQGLKRILWTDKSEWSVKYASDGTQGLSALAGSEFDVIISDYNMPLMDGSAFLSHVAQTYPEVIRIVLSGECDEKVAMDLVQTAHLFLSKPTDSSRLIDFIERSVQLREALHNKELAKTITGVKALPSLGGVYPRLDVLLNDEKTNINQLVDLISEDPALTSKILQISNAAFFNVNWHVTNLPKAMEVIGYQVLKSLVLVHGLIDQSELMTIGGFDLEKVMQDSVQAGFLARSLAQSFSEEGGVVAEDAFTATILSKIGLMITVKAMQPKMEKAVALALEEDVPLYKAEREVYGCTHAEICAYLLTIWGLPHSLVEAVQFHLTPHGYQKNDNIDLIQVTHAASVFYGQISRVSPMLYSLKDEGLFEGPKNAERWKTFEKVFSTFKAEKAQKSA